jgi:hypothetical protein
MLLKASHGSELIGLAALTLKRGAIRRVLPVRQAWLNCSGDPELDSITVEHNGFASPAPLDHLLLPALIDWFAAGGTTADELVLPGVAPGSLDTAGKGLIQTDRCDPAYRTSLAGITEPEGIGPHLSRNARQQLHRSVRAYEREAPLSLDAATNVETALGFFTRLKDLHVRSWNRRGRRHAFDRPFFETFHRALITAGFADGDVDLLHVSAGQRTLGYLYNFRRNGTVLSYQSGFDDGTPGLRPGYVCHALAMAHYAKAGMANYDFLAGSNRLKQSFGTERYELCWRHFRKPTVAFRAEDLVRTAAGFLKRQNGRN